MQRVRQWLAYRWDHRRCQFGGAWAIHSKCSIVRTAERETAGLTPKSIAEWGAQE